MTLKYLIKKLGIGKTRSYYKREFYYSNSPYF